VGCGKPTFVCMPHEPERYDIMYRFATGVCVSYEELVKALKGVLL